MSPKGTHDHKKQNYHDYGSNPAPKNERKALAVIYPVFAYFAICQVVGLLIGMLPFSGLIDDVKRQGIGSLVAFVVLYLYFVRGQLVGSEAKTCNREGTEQIRLLLTSLSGKAVAGMVLAACVTGCAGIAMNNLLALTGIRQMSQSYQNVEQAFYSSGLGWELLALGIITPVAEELLYRYIVFYKLRRWQGPVTAIAGSALIFGVMHMNIVQIIYGSVIGLLLGILMEYYQDVRVVMCGHAMANILSLLRGETDFLAWLRIGHPWFVPVTVLLLALVVVIAGLLARTFKND